MNQMKFDDIKTFDDWNIYLSSYEIGDAQPKEYYIDIPSGDGSLDLTEALTGRTSYGDRTFDTTFILKPPRSDWTDKLDEIRTFLNGRKRKLIEPLDTDHYYMGRFKTSFSNDGVIGILSVTGTLDPFKYKHQITVREISIAASGVSNINLKNSNKVVIPTIITSGNIVITFNNKSIGLNAGTRRVTNILLTEGDNPIKIEGNAGASVKFEYQEGAL